MFLRYYEGATPGGKRPAPPDSLEKQKEKWKKYEEKMKMKCSLNLFVHSAIIMINVFNSFQNMFHQTKQVPCMAAFRVILLIYLCSW